MEKRDLENALNSMLRTDYIPLDATDKLRLLADYYIDYFGYLGQVLGDNDQLIVGRRGTGKTTLLYRALVECMRSWGDPESSRAKPRTLGIYIDLEKCQSLSQQTDSDFEHFEHAFVSELCEALTAELSRSWPAFSETPNVFGKLFKSAEQKKASDVKKHLDRLVSVLTSGVPRFVDKSGPVKQRKATKQKVSTHSGVKGTLSPVNPSISADIGEDDSYETEDEVRSSSNVSYRLTISDILKILGDLRKAAGIPCVLLFVDEFSALSDELQGKFSTLLKKILGNHSGVFVKLGAITDNYRLGSSIILQRDLFKLSLDLDAFVELSGSLGAAMTELELLTEKIVRERFKVYGGFSAEEVIDNPDDAWFALSRSAMGVPRTLGIVLKQAWYRSEAGDRPRIGRRDIDAGIRYASKTYLDQMLGSSIDGLGIPAYIPEIWDSLLGRALRERGKSKGPSSHFMVLPRNELRLKYLNMFFLIHLLTEGRTTKKEKESRSLYAFDYGICLENNLRWGDDKNVIRQQRFAYDDSLSEFDNFFKTQVEVGYICPTCGTIYTDAELQVGSAFLHFCPKDRSNLEKAQSVSSERRFTEEEIKILGTIRMASEDDQLVARRVADDVGCYVQKVAKFGEKLDRADIIGRKQDPGLGRNIYFGEPT